MDSLLGLDRPKKQQNCGKNYSALSGEKLAGASIALRHLTVDSLDSIAAQILTHFGLLFPLGGLAFFKFSNNTGSFSIRLLIPVFWFLDIHNVHSGLAFGFPHKSGINSIVGTILNNSTGPHSLRMCSIPLRLSCFSVKFPLGSIKFILGRRG